MSDKVIKALNLSDGRRISIGGGQRVVKTDKDYEVWVGERTMWGGKPRRVARYPRKQVASVELEV